jgi:hypothetical protein
MALTLLMLMLMLMQKAVATTSVAVWQARTRRWLLTSGAGSLTALV